MMRKKHGVLILLLLVALVASACAAKSVPSGIRGAVAEHVTMPAGSSADSDETGAWDAERMIVRTAQLSLVVTDVEASLAQIKGVVGALGGYVSDARLWREEEQLRGTVTVRIPAQSLDDALAKFKAMAVRVERESSGSQDVTEEYSDLGARLRNLEAAEQELLELLKTVREKGGKAEDILAVHRELTAMRGEIEQLKGRMQYLESTSDMAAVTIELIPDALARPISVGGWRPSATLANALRSLLRTLRFVVDAGIWVVFYVLPVVLVLLVPLAVVWVIWRRKRNGRPQAKD